MLALNITKACAAAALAAGVIYSLPAADAHAQKAAPGGHSGATLTARWQPDHDDFQDQGGFLTAQRR